jgi:nitrogen fixation/metabolism regulation signal transduction histidine kinase
MHELLFNVCEYIKTRAPKSITFIIEDKINKNILGDHILLDWAFQNIIKNSVDAISNNRNGEILITIDTYSGNYLYIDIQDNGKGISRKNRKNIFKPGFSSKKRGWGLGLSLTKRIVEEIHLGKIWLLQSHDNKTIMRTILPL